MPKAITSLEGYIRKLAKLDSENIGAQLLFRGHSSHSHSISPSVFRSNNLLSSEHLMLRQLLAQHPSDFTRDQGLFDQLVRAQHYGLPTRLLDVSFNPLVALYFAVCSRPKSRAQIIVFKPDIGKQKYFDSDVVSCLSGLSLLSHSEKKIISDKAVDCLRKAINDDGSKMLKENMSGELLKDFNDTAEVQKLIQQVRTEKPNFRKIIQPLDLFKPVAVTPRKHHSRIIAQNGAFLLFGFGKKPTDTNMDHIQYDVIDIDSKSKSRFLKELSYVGISETSLFPEIEKAAIAIKSRYS